MILAIDTSTDACSVALIGHDGVVVDARDEVLNRGHAERLVPMIAELLNDSIPSAILVGIGPGSFTGLRVGIAAAHGLAIGWDVPISGMSSLALLAASAEPDGPIAAAMSGGHGELFVQAFSRPPLADEGALLNLPPLAAAARITTPLVVGPGAAALVEARGSGTARSLYPSARFAITLPVEYRMLDCRPFYARAPDATPKVTA